MTAPIRPTHVTVSLAALAHNLAFVRHKAPHKRICAVVKANAYGHGAATVAQALQKSGVDAFGVALVEEGVDLRRGGITRPILVWGAALQADACVAHDLCPVVERLDQVEALQAAAAAAGTKLAVHIEVDTGMARLGLAVEALPALLEALARAPNLEFEGLMTHLAVADVPLAPFNVVQTRRFAEAQNICAAKGVWPQVVHVDNSPAALSRNADDTNMARCGLALYGMQPLVAQLVPELRPALSWHSRIVSLRSVAQGMSVSYGCRFVAPQDMRIATLPVGYADGYRRAFSDRGHVLIRGQRAPVVGTVCMDLTMVDVSHIEGATLADEAVLLGTQGSHGIPAELLATWADTISYEIVCGIGARVPRRYIDASGAKSHP